MRVIAESTSDLSLLVEKIGIRHALYYLLHTLCLDIPPLRERPEDVRLLSGKYILSACERYNRYITLTNGAKKAPEEYRWDGISCSFAAFAENIVLIAPKRCLDENFLESHLPPDVPQGLRRKGRGGGPADRNHRGRANRRAFEKHNGNRGEVAAEMGISTTTPGEESKNTISQTASP